MKLTLFPSWMRQPEGSQQLSPEEEARNKRLMRERDRERKRMKRMNPEYRKMEQERDRDRKKARRANEAFRQLEKLRDKIRKDRKKGLTVANSLPTDYNSLPLLSVEPEVIISDDLPVQTNQSQSQQQAIHLNNNNNQSSRTESNLADMSIGINKSSANVTQTTSSEAETVIVAAAPSPSNSTTLTPHISHLSKGLMYSAHTFPHHSLPHLPGVPLMPQLCHPMLHQNIGASLYPPNGIKQEYNDNISQHGSNGPNNGASCEQDREFSLIEPEIILQTSPDIIAAPHHFHNHTHAHHLHQQHAWPQAHIPPHMRTSLPPPSQQQQVLPPPLNSTLEQNNQQHQMSHYNQSKIS